MTHLNKFIPIALGGLAIVSLLSMSSCKDKFSTETKFDTVFVSNPDWDDSTWVASNSGTTQNLVRAQFLNENLGFVVGASGTVLRTNNAGLTWSLLTPTPIDN